MFIKAFEDETMHGIYNAVAPSPEINKYIIKAVKEIKSASGLLIRIPAFVLRLFIGERSSILLDGQKISCKKISDSGFQFEFPQLKGALENIFRT